MLEAVEEQHRRSRAERELSVWFEGGDAENGALLINGRMDNATGRYFQAALRAMVDRLWREDGGRRRLTQRRTHFYSNDVIGALATLASSGVDTDALPVRTMPHLIATVADDSIEFLDGQPVLQAFLDSLDSRTIDTVGHVFSGNGKPLWTGRRHRLATVHQWTTLIARDRGCVDCGADVAFTEAHHPHQWRHHGPNDIDNLELKCRHTDHALAHQGPRAERRSRPRAA